ncbi:MAG: hypothetical protein NTX59_02305 [Elusimicrobia bacterium]|nr:hypothetical protein [Elusimicrobiota bacterium]
MKPIIRIAITVLLVATILGIGIISRRRHNDKTKDEAAEMITGTVMDGGNKIEAGVLIFASTGTITDPPPVLYAKAPPDSTLYTTVSGTDGKYSLEVRASRSSYNMRAFYSVPNSNNQTFTTTSKTKSGIIVNKGSKVSDQNFAWP